MMVRRLTFWFSLLVAIALPVAATSSEAPAVERHDIRVNGGKLHYLRAGTGPKTLVLIHGWPQSSHEFERIIPRLARRYTVIAPDLRAVGGSSATGAGYDKAALAEDLHQLVLALRPKGPVYAAGHDIGGMVAYAWLRAHPDGLAGVAILDVVLPGVGPWEQIASSPQAWHFGFHQQPRIPEHLVQGRQSIYFRDFYDALAANPKAITAADVATYAKAYASPASLRAGFEWYRAFVQDARFNRDHGAPIDVPVMLIGGERSTAPLLDAQAEGLRALGVRSVSTIVIPASGHWLAEEAPAALVEALERFVGP